MERHKVERALAARERFFNIGLIAVIAFNDERCFGERQTVAEVAMCSEFCSAAENESPFCAMRRMRSYSRLFFRISVRYSLQQFAAFKGCGRPFAVIFSKMTRRRTFSASAMRFLFEQHGGFFHVTTLIKRENTLKIAATERAFSKYDSVCSGWGSTRQRVRQILGRALFKKPRFVPVFAPEAFGCGKIGFRRPRRCGRRY